MPGNGVLPSNSLDEPLVSEDEGFLHCGTESNICIDPAGNQANGRHKL